jgi:hypothetical protein
MSSDHAHAFQIGDVEIFSSSRIAELDGLRERGVFYVVSRSSVPDGMQIYGTKWVYTTKTGDDGKVVTKSRLVAQNYRCHNAREFLQKCQQFADWEKKMRFAWLQCMSRSTLTCAT